MLYHNACTITTATIAAVLEETFEQRYRIIIGMFVFMLFCINDLMREINACDENDR